MTFSDANKENMQNIGKSRKCTKIQRALVSRTSSDERLFQKGSVPAALKSCQNHDMENALQEKSSLLEQHALVTSFDVFKVAFTTSAQQQIQNFMNKSPLQKFIFKCAVTSEFSQDECCLSPVFTTIPSRVVFMQKMEIKAVVGDSKITFGLCIKSIEKSTAPLFIGFSSFTLSNCSIGVSHKNCLLVNEEGTKVGSVLLKIDIMIGENNITLSCCERFNRCLIIYLTHIDQDLKIKKCPHQSHRSKTCENKGLQTDETPPAQPAREKSLETSVGNNPSKKLAVEERKSISMCGGFQGILLLFIEKIRNIRNEMAADYFITYECFWDRSLETTDNSVKGLFYYLKQFSLTCDESFLNRVLNNHLELKLWEKSQYSEKIVGTTFIPLHQFFIAFHDKAMIGNNLLPVISFDSWANFLIPLSNESFCECKILVAVGSENQIDYLKVLRNLENMKIQNRSVIEDGLKNIETHETQPCLNNKLSAFMSSFSQKYEESVIQPTSKQIELLPTHSSETQKTPQFGKTSELLDSLKKALLEPPPATRSLFGRSTKDPSMSQEKVRAIVNIDFATNLKLPKKKQNRRKIKGSEFEPAVYATFESVIENNNELLLQSIVKSHEGLVHSTNVVRGCEPHWNQNFDVFLLLDTFQNPQKKFIVKIWRKVKDADMIPTPFVDAAIGFCAIDLSVLMTGLPVLSGFYNIVDYSGKVNGQIKLSLTPQEALPQNQSFVFRENIPNIADDDGPNLLSRTLKRKFSELDEITQRLRARLDDVTRDETLVSSDDEFERDLNTCADNDEISSCTQDFAWLNDSNGNNLSEQPSTSKAVNPLSTIHSQNDMPDTTLNLDKLLKKYDLDAIVNPDIFKNLVDPSLANSDSTPTLNHHSQANSLSDRADFSNDRVDTTSDRILLQMQTALKKATLNENLSEPSSRKDPDGENNA